MYNLYNLVLAKGQ